MYVLLMRDGSRNIVECGELLEAVRETVRSHAIGLEVGEAPPSLMTYEQALQEIDLARPGLFDRFSETWCAPSPSEFRELLRIAKLSGSQAGQLVGLPGGRIRKWAGGDGSVPYAVWRLLSIYVGLAPVEVAPWCLLANKEITK